MSLKQQITDDMKSAMKAKDSGRLAAIRLIMAALKQKEVDERVELTDVDVLQILDKMSKQRRESISQFEDAGRNELADKEQFELSLIQGYLPKQMDDEEVNRAIDEAVQTIGAASMKDMGKVMAALKGTLQGRTDMSAVSRKIKEKLSA